MKRIENLELLNSEDFKPKAEDIERAVMLVAMASAEDY